MNYINIVQKIKNSIALIIVLDQNNKMISTGSGFVFVKKNILITCNHVVKNANSIMIKFPDKEDLIVSKVLIQDNEHDIALLKIELDDRIPLEKEEVSNIKEGMPIIFSGYPLSISALTTHRGMLSAVSEDSTGATTYLIDGTVNPGNSGCPLLSEDGKVIGVVNATRREHADLLQKVSSLNTGTFSIHGIDMIEIYQALIRNLQLGIGYAIPAAYVPEYKEMKNDDIQKITPETPIKKQPLIEK